MFMEGCAVKDLILSLEATCDLDKETIKKYDLSVVDMEFKVGDDFFKTSEHDVVSSGLYEKMVKKQKTSTSQINAYDYEQHFLKLLEQDKPILHLAFSSSLSGTGLVAKQVADELNESHDTKIYVIDTLCGSYGQGLLAILIRENIDKFENIEDVIKFVESNKFKMRHLFTVDTLTYLANGGRLDSKTAFFGNLLNIKPVMHLSRNGKLEVVHKVISRKKSICNLVDMIKKTYDENSKICFIAHANCEKDAIFLESKLKTDFDINTKIVNLGPVIGAHSGPGTLAIFYLGKDERD